MAEATIEQLRGMTEDEAVQRIADDNGVTVAVAGQMYAAIVLGGDVVDTDDPLGHLPED